MYFLFGILDKEKRAADFRDCYPILDKKSESQFRQKAYAWYSGIISMWKAPGGENCQNVAVGVDMAKLFELV